MTSYRIVNPYTIGSNDNCVVANNEKDASEKAWLKMSEHYTGILPDFSFTLENEDNNKYYHFNVREKHNTNGEASFKIKQIETKQKKEKELRNNIKELNEFEQELQEHRVKQGGKKRYDNSESSSSDSDSDSVSYSKNDKKIMRKLKMIKMMNQPRPIDYWWYSPYVYGTTSVAVPSFVVPSTPYISNVQLTYGPFWQYILYP